MLHNRLFPANQCSQRSQFINLYDICSISPCEMCSGIEKGQPLAVQCVIFAHEHIPKVMDASKHKTRYKHLMCICAMRYNSRTRILFFSQTAKHETHIITGVGVFIARRHGYVRRHRISAAEHACSLQLDWCARVDRLKGGRESACTSIPNDRHAVRSSRKSEAACENNTDQNTETLLTRSHLLVILNIRLILCFWKRFLLIFPLCQ